jgi:dipeptidase
MCDTVVATPEVTADGVMVFGKNSDREPNEAHQLVRMPAAEHAPGSLLQCTYIEIPQVEHTHAVLLAKPFWMWGAEMGANEHGLVIGNEAVFTKVPYEKSRGLTGMDLLRLALERARTARQALDTITELLARHGQGGSGGYQHPFYYHNSFILADARQAWVLETAGPHWAARQVRGQYTISNGLTIGNEWDLASPDLVRYAVEKRWCRGRDDFDFARCYSDPLYTRLSDCHKRCKRTGGLLASQKGRVTPRTVMAVLRDHGLEDDAAWAPDHGLTGVSVCSHAGFGPVRSSQTTGSMVSHLHPEHPLHFLTGTAAPCTGIFKPAWMDLELPGMGPAPGASYDAASLWWRHEALHRATLRDPAALIGLYRAEREGLEQEFVERALALAGCPAEERAAFARSCFAQADAAERRWLEKVAGEKVGRRLDPLYRRAWDRLNRQVGLAPANQ